MGTTDPFALLGLPRRYDLERRAIEAAHLRRLAVLHPDRIDDPLRRAEAVGEMAEANQARDVLLDPERRAEALLRLLGGPAKEAEKSLPEGFLAETLELREAMEAAVESDDETRRREFVALVAERRAAHEAAVAGHFATALAGAAPAPESLRAIRLELNAWRYVERMREALG